MIEKPECCDNCHTSNNPNKCKLFGTNLCDTLNKYRSDKISETKTVELVECNEAHKEYFESIDEMEKEKDIFINKIKECVKPEHFQNILDEIEESENTGNYRIIDEPKGEPQYNKEFGYTVWIYQIRISEDWYNGTVCVKLPNGKYFIWDFEI